MAEQNRSITDAVEISLRPFRKPDGSVILVAADSQVINLSDPDGNIIIILDNYYTKAETYSQGQVNSLFNNYYTRTESDNLFVVSGQTATGPVIINNGGALTARVTEDGHFMFDGTSRSSQLGITELRYFKDSVTDYNTTQYLVSNDNGDRVVFETDSAGMIKLRNGVYVNEIDNDTGLTTNSDNKLATQRAIKTYVDAAFSGSVPLTGSTNSFNINGELSFTGGNAIDGTGSSNEVTYLGSSPTDQFTLSFQDSQGTQLSEFIIEPEEVQIVSTSGGAVMVDITPTLAQFSGGLQADSITLSAGQTAYEISSDPFVMNVSGYPFTEDQVIPTQAGVRDHVFNNAINTVNGGTIGTSAQGMSLSTQGISVSGDATSAGADWTSYGHDSIQISSNVIPASGDAFVISVNNVTAMQFTGTGNIKLSNDVAVNRFTDVLGQAEDAVPTEAAIRSYVLEVAQLIVETPPGNSFTVPASAGEYYVDANTSSGPFTLDLPPSPDTGFRVWVKDGDDNASNNNITVNGNGNNIDGLATNVISVDNQGRIFLYNGNEWKVFGI